MASHHSPQITSATAVPEPSFADLALYFTAPSYWLPGHASKLRDFILFLLDPSRPGVGAFGAPSGDGDDDDAPPTWLDLADVPQYVNRLYTESWLPADGVPPDSSALASERFRQLVRTKSVLFLDQTRLESCCKSAGDDYFEHDSEQWPDPYWIGLTIDWARYSTALTWFPQFRIYNYWPRSPVFAPPAPASLTAGALQGPQLSAETAATVLEDLYWRRIESNVRGLRAKFGLGTANTGPFESPVFYMSEPSIPPRTPDEYLNVDWSRALVPFTEKELRLADPLADKAATAILEGRFMVFSTALRSSRSEMRQDYYLVIPAAGSPTDGISAADERLAHLADQLSYMHFRAAKMASEVTMESQLLTLQIRLESVILEHARDTAERILTVVSAGRHGAHDRTENILRSLTREFQLVVEKMKLKFAQIDLDARGLRAELAQNTATDAEEMTQRLTIRTAGTGRKLSGETLAPSVMAAEALEDLSRESASEVRKLEGLKATFDGVLAHIEQGERERDERGQKTLNYLLGFLAAVVALPLLIGHMSWAELGMVLNQKSAVGGIVWELHPAVTWIGAVATVAAITMLVWYLLMRSEHVQSWLTIISHRWRSSHEPRKEIASVWLSVSEKRVPGRDEDGTDTEIDEAVVQALAKECEWLLEQTSKSSDGISASGLQGRVRVLGALSELFLQRPNPLSLPRTLLFLRSCGPRFFSNWVGYQTVDDLELEFSLVSCGYSQEAARKLVEQTARTEWTDSASTISDLVSTVRAAVVLQSSVHADEDGPTATAIPQHTELTGAER